jgi:hypothetical protein
MRTVTRTIYKFDELSDDAKEKARDWARSTFDYAWETESDQSIRAFCDHFGARIRYSVEEYWFEAQVNSRNFRGMKLKEFNREHMPTGYCMDCALWQTFYDEFKRTTDAHAAFNAAIYAALKEWRDDREYQRSDEYIDKTITINEYEFTEDGRIYTGR